MGADRTPAPRRDVPILAFALFFPVIMTWIYFVVMHQEDAADNLGFRLAYTLGKATQFLLPIVYVAAFDRARLRWDGFCPTAKGLGLGLGFGLLVAGAMLLLYFAALRDSPWLAAAPEKILSRLRQFGLATPAGFLGMAIFYCVVHSFLEEYYWRWFVFRGFRGYVGVPGAIAVSAFGFMLHHVVVLYVYFPGQFWLLALPFSLAVAVGGAVWAWLYQLSGSLLGPWLSHLLIDAAIMIVGYAQLAPYWQ
jgi:uncharacterized protein